MVRLVQVRRLIQPGGGRWVAIPKKSPGKTQTGLKQWGKAASTYPAVTARSAL